ncbi:hypothetical protein ES332_A08G184800v1 [Gossypium tomentosum]|uniref:Uncharacterized protein n=1 Tax=Gossypium tomentosum TaxID=34277 RepID=A0A5D2PGI3_GOSTO|nr:hypothetical protein ES332_A08G184800v1 [Gossypium tomentosum]
MMSIIFISNSQKLRSCYSLTMTMACIKLVLCLFISVYLCSFVHYHDENNVTLSGMRGDIEMYTFICAFLYKCQHQSLFWYSSHSSFYLDIPVYVFSCLPIYMEFCLITDDYKK